MRISCCRYTAARSPRESGQSCDDGRRMGPGIIIPVLLLAVVVPVAFVWARRRFKEPGSVAANCRRRRPIRLTSKALRTLESPPWRVVYEIGQARMGGVEHVLVGPGGIFAVVTSMDPMPSSGRRPGSARRRRRGDPARRARRCAAPVRDDERSSRHRSLGGERERGATQYRGVARCHRGRRSSPARLGGRCRRPDATAPRSRPPRSTSPGRPS